ncbi:PrgI family mobile element protein [Anaerocellum danielii]|uniref:PrgI family protein n=1 Tax=Anaerocellum danielii TaxID=1387557 RepID=A0ABZ0TYS8_9FIRM|nr:PrgI family protein [Caldicellulosiruptor danielii]WPX08221.1 PrgI family protein [Caldicellulosiruptor danielii]
MQRYRIPYEFKFEDKIVGGFLTWRQTLILVVPSLAMFSMLSNFHVPFAIALIVELLTIAVCSIFAFVKVNGDDFITFLKKYYDFMTRKRIILNREEE